MTQFEKYVIPFSKLGIKDVDKVGGKNASLGEMISHLSHLSIKVPDGFATTSHAFFEFLALNHLNEKIYSLLDKLDVEEVSQLKHTGLQIRSWIEGATLQPELVAAISQSYQALQARSVAVRSSATAEDLPEASFAGQQETLLNVQGLEAVLQAVKQVFASLFNDRAIAYRVHQQFDHRHIALSVGIQKMVRSDLAASGVMFTLDTESGFDQVVLTTSAFGLGELVVQGAVNPDEFYVHKPTLLSNRPAIIRRNLGAKQQKLIYADGGVKAQPVLAAESKQFSLTDSEVELLARYALIIEKHYGRAMDIEWAKDGLDQQIYIVQARPETVKSRNHSKTIERYQLLESAPVLAQGRSIGQRIASGRAHVIKDMSQMDELKSGEVLIADMTDPDWEPIMKRSAAIVTNRGGRTCHAAIIARELGIPAVVGCHDATRTILDGQWVTVSCAEGDVGYVYQGQLPIEIKRIELDKMPPLPFKMMLNVANPDRAFDFQFLPNMGVGLARLEFIISQMIGIHPNACLAYESLSPLLQEKIRLRSSGYHHPKQFYIKKLIEGISTLAAAFAPKKVIVRLSDFKSNEYANLLGGEQFEPKEENPMMGFRGALRYISESFKDCVALECEAIRFVRETMGLTNVEIMIPFVRTLSEAKQVLALLAAQGLKRGVNGLKIIMMCELPTNAILAEQYLEYFDGFSIGSNDLTQLTLGLDRDSGIVANDFDERDQAVKYLMEKAIRACKNKGKYIGICGQGPSDHPDLAQWLVEQGIESLSLNPDCVLETWLLFAS